MSEISSLPVYNIIVGNPDSYTDDANTDMAPSINSEISAAPSGSQIDITFEPGEYGTDSQIFLPSNCSVIGNDATIVALGKEQNGGIFANADAYFNGPWTIVNGTTTGVNWLWSYTSDDTSGTFTEPSSLDAIIDSNISVQDMTFDLQNGWIFGTWFTNARNIDVQNNTYIGGVDGNAFVNVVDSVVSNNIGIGQINSPFDNWDGPVNISIQDNSAYTNGGWGVLMNSTPTGDPQNPGNAENDDITDNNFSTSVENLLMINANALLSYGFTFEENITEQGNVFSLNDVPGDSAVYSADPQYNLLIQDNEVLEANNLGADFTGAIYVVDSGANSTAEPKIEGNLVVGSSNSPGVSSVVVMGSILSALDNAVLGANFASGAQIGAYNFDGDPTVKGNVASSGQSVSGSPISPTVLVEAIPTLFISPGTSTSDLGIDILSSSSLANLSVTISSIFGTISDSVDQNVINTVSNGIEMIIFSGNGSELSQIISNVVYQSDAQGFDDSIEIQVSGTDGLFATRYIPVISEGNSTGLTSIQTLSSGEFSSEATVAYPGTLTGNAIVASSGNSLIDMGTNTSVVMLGSGNNTVLGGYQDGYISGGSGDGTLDFFRGGDITVAGGAGGIDVNAMTGNDIIQTGAGGGTIDLGVGNCSILGGLGEFSVYGNSGNIYIASLPEDGGDFSASLGTGNATIFALSGNDLIETEAGSNSFIFLGLGNSSVTSGGNDSIFTGSGDTTIDAVSGGCDSIVGGLGNLCFIGGVGNALIDPDGLTTVIAGSGTTDILPGQNLTVEINYLASTHRNIDLEGGKASIILLGFGVDPIASQCVSNGTILLGLSDGTSVVLPDIADQMVSYNNGTLAFGGIGLGNEAFYNLDAELGANTNYISPGAVISSLIQSAPIGDSVVVVSSGFQSNGIINI